MLNVLQVRPVLPLQRLPGKRQKEEREELHHAQVVHGQVEHCQRQGDHQSRALKQLLPPLRPPYRETAVIKLVGQLPPPPRPVQNNGCRCGIPLVLVPFTSSMFTIYLAALP